MPKNVIHSKLIPDVGNSQASTGALSENAPWRKSLIPQEKYQVVNKDPNRAYRFISLNHLNKSGGFDPRGWIPLNETNSKGEKLKSAYGTEHGGTDIRVGGMVLAYMPKEINDLRIQEIEHRTQAIHQRGRSFEDQHRDFRASASLELQKVGRSEL